MCGTCNGRILLRSIDGMTKQVSVKDCGKLDTWRVPYVNRHVSAVRYLAADADTFPTEALTNYREYRRSRHEEVEGMPVFDEVVATPPRKQRRIADIDALLIEEAAHVEAD